MPLELLQRGEKWWIQGRLDGIDGYIRRSLGTSDRAVAEAKKAEIERRARQRAILGEDAPSEAEELTFSGAVMLYKAKPADAGFLMKLIPHLGDRKVKDIKPLDIRKLGALLYPRASVDTWRRQVVTPACAVINNAHQLGLAAPIRVKSYSASERVLQDEARGKTSRKPKTPGSWEWINAFRAEANPYQAAIALFMFTTGARVTQAVSLTPNDLDLQRGRVWMPAAKGHEAQWVDIIPEMVTELANLPPRNGRVFGYATRHSVYKAWSTACQKAGIEYIPPHAAGRHGYGTELIVRQGLDPVTVAKEGRWSSPKIPLDTYAHAEQSSRKVREALERGSASVRTKPEQSEMIKSPK